MAASRDLTGQKFGMLTVVAPTEKRESGSIVWECKCDCGNTTFAAAIKLTAKKKQSCGCLRGVAARARASDLVGMRSGRLTVVRPTANRKNGSVVWECKCDCGNTAFYSAIALQSGKLKSCGCGRKDTYGNKIRDIEGLRFGRLTAVRPTEKRDNRRSVIWECRCDCGNTVFVTRGNLRSGSTQSCGCLHKEVMGNIYSNILKPQFVMGTKLDSLRESETKLRSDNKTGVKGVYVSEGYFIASLRFRNVLVMKRCKTLEQAAEVRGRMRRIHEEFLEWWDSLSEEEKTAACMEYENEKVAQVGLLKKRMKELKDW